MRMLPAVVLTFALIPAGALRNLQIDAIDVQSVWDGSYTTAQGERGQRLYTTHCARCHGTDLLADGPEQLARDAARLSHDAPQRTPPLLGPTFIGNWNGLAVGDLFERTRVSMPQQAPGSLTGQQVADIVAYLLQQNGFPSGNTELPKERDRLQHIRIVAAR